MEEFTVEDYETLIDALEEVYPAGEVNVPIRVRQLKSYLAYRRAQLDRPAAA